VDGEKLKTKVAKDYFLEEGFLTLQTKQNLEKQAAGGVHSCDDCCRYFQRR
jgi:hypothetical protein